ncbi:unnamed protein product, partial [Ranitomeya imitator]
MECSKKVSWVPEVDSADGVIWVPEVDSADGRIWVPEVDSADGVIWVPEVDSADGGIWVPEVNSADDGIWVPKVDSADDGIWVPEVDSADGGIWVPKVDSADDGIWVPKVDSADDGIWVPEVDSADDGIWVPKVDSADGGIWIPKVDSADGGIGVPEVNSANGASWFTKIDLHGAYNLVRIKQGDEWKTAFNSSEGHFEYLVMPFGLSNAPSVFQSFMQDIFREYLDKFLIVYLDDILVFSDDWESHVKQVRMVFQVLRANSLFVKGSKCLFGVQKVSFLGFIFSPSTIEMDLVKVQAIYDWTQPTSLKSLQKFLGFANFYRRFINNFSSIAKPLTDLTKKGADVVNWSSAAVEAFQELKRRFSSAPVLCQPDVSLPFQVEVDASEIGAGAVLSQRSSDGWKFSPAERNYDVGNRELLAMKWAFEEWRHWLEGAKHRVVVLTDHKNLTYLESAKRLNPRQARQVESSDCPGVDTVVDRLQQIWTHVVDNLTLSQEKAQCFANRRRCVGPRLRVGDLVWLSSRYIPMKVSSPKFKPRFIGPYRISEVLNPVSFRLTLLASFSIHNVFHRSLLRRYVAPVVPSVDPPAPVLVEGELEYIVEKILDSRISRRKLQYLVKWKGYGQEDNSWVFASDVHAADLVRAFHLAHPGRPGGSACYIAFSCLLEALGRRGSTSVPLVDITAYLDMYEVTSVEVTSVEVTSVEVTSVEVTKVFNGVQVWRLGGHDRDVMWWFPNGTVQPERCGVSTGWSRYVTGESGEAGGPSYLSAGRSRYVTGESGEAGGPSYLSAGWSRYVTGESGEAGGPSYLSAGWSRYVTGESGEAGGPSYLSAGWSRYVTGESGEAGGPSYLSAGWSRYVTGESGEAGGPSYLSTGWSRYVTGESGEAGGPSYLSWL